jgi:hypothetical protein
MITTQLQVSPDGQQFCLSGQQQAFGTIQHPTKNKIN